MNTKDSDLNKEIFSKTVGQIYNNYDIYILNHINQSLILVKADKILSKSDIVNISLSNSNLYANN